MRVDLFILNYNGASYALDSIASFLEAIKRSSYECKLFVIDNSSTDNSVELIRRQFFNVKILSMKNRVLCSFNEAARGSNADVVFLLNNDLKVASDSLDHAIRLFQNHNDLFMVSMKSFLQDGSYEGGLAKPFLQLGIFGTTCHFKGHEKLIGRTNITFAAGFGAFDRKKFLELDGYDDLYLPGRLEDVDLCLRAWKKGWKSYYQPKSIVWHIGAKSFNERFGRRGTMELAYRNTFLFMWKNFRTPQYWFSHVIFLLPKMLWMLAKGRHEFITGFVKATRKIPTVIQRRKKEKSMAYKHSEREIMEKFRRAY